MSNYITDTEFLMPNSKRATTLHKNESIRNQNNPLNPKAIIIPITAEESSDIEILEENIIKKTLKKKRKSKAKHDLHTMKKINLSSQNEKTDVCGLQVSIKSLLKNDEIRKQIAPFIEEVVIDCSESDSEETNAPWATVQKKNERLTDEQILDKAKDIIAKNLTKLKKKSKSIKQKNGNNHLTVTNKDMDGKNSQMPEKIQVLDLTTEISDDDIILSERAKTKKSTKKTKAHNKKIGSFAELKQNSLILEDNSENVVIDANIFVIDGLQQHHENINSKYNDIPDLPIMDSDDWYYLNIACAPKNSSIEDDVLIIQNSLKLNKEEEFILPVPIEQVEIEKRVKEKPQKPAAVVHRKKRKRRGRKLWTICGNRNTKKNSEKAKINKKYKPKNSLNVDDGIQVGNLKIESSIIIGSQANNETKAQSACLDNGTFEISNEKKEKLTFSHELIPVIKKETESLDTLGSEVSQNTNCNQSTDKIETNNDLSNHSLNNDASKPLLKPYIIKEITPDFYRNEEKVYKTYQRISAKRKIALMNIQNRWTKNNYNDKTFFKKRSKFTVKCSKCGRKYERLYNLRRHEQTCNADTKANTELQCSKCSYKTFCSDNYQNHVATHLVDTNLITNYENHMHVRCSMCPLKRDLHQRGNNCVKCHSCYKFLCRMCGNDYPNYASLKSHVLRSIQLGYGKTCRKCGRGGYPALCALKRHVHNCEVLPDKNQKKIICNKIPYVRLVRHEEPSKDIHQMNIRCSNCDAFSTTCKRAARCENCQADVSYKCELCKEFLPSYSNLQTHVFNVHIMDSGMCLENKSEAIEDLERKNDCDKINYSSDSDIQDDNMKQSLEKEKDDSTNHNNVHEQTTESSLIEEKVEKLDSSNEVVDKLQEKQRVLLRFEPDKSNNGMNEVSVPKCSEDVSIKFHDATLNDIMNSNVTKDQTCDSSLNEKCLEERNNVQLGSVKRQYKTGIKRYCLKCDKTKKDLDVIRIGSKKEVCEKCRSELLYQCVKCKRKSNIYSVMLHHWKHFCAFLRPKNSFAVKSIAPEKYKNSNIYNRIERHQCLLCPYSSNLKNRLMLHLQTHLWKDIKNAVFNADDQNDTRIKFFGLKRSNFKRQK